MYDDPRILPPLMDMEVARAPGEPLCCTPKSLPDDLKAQGAARAIAINPSNRPRAERIIKVVEAITGVLAPSFVLAPEHLTLMTQKYWGAGGVKLTVGFMEPLAAGLRDKILSYMNLWSKYCNAAFTWTQTDPQLRISRGPGGYWSYPGTDNLSIPKNQQTMNLEGFTLSTPDSEYMRVIPHETGHAMGFPHEHMRREIVVGIDVQKAIAYFGRTQGWSPAVVRQQVLTPLDEASIRGTPHADRESIMCYQLPGEIMLDGRPVIGGSTIDALDQTFAGTIYPLAVQPPIEPPVGVGADVSLNISGARSLTVNGRPVSIL